MTPAEQQIIETTITELREEADNAARRAQYYRTHKPRNVNTHALQSAYEEYRALMGTLAQRLETLTSADVEAPETPGHTASPSTDQGDYLIPLVEEALVEAGNPGPTALP